MLWSFIPIDIGPCCHLPVCGRQTVTLLHSHSHVCLAKTAEEYFQSKCQHALRGVISRNFFSRTITAAVIVQHSSSTISYWHVTVPFHQVYKNPWSSIRIYVAYARFQVTTAVSLTIQISYNVTLCRWVRSSKPSKGLSLWPA